MSKWNRRLTALAIVAALVAGVSCTSSDTDSPVAPSAEPQPALIGTLLSVTDLLTCQALPYKVTTQAVGPEGGTIVVGQYSLVIPQGALSQRVSIKAEQMSGSVNSVRFSPEGLRFAKSAQLTMSYKNCILVLKPKKIAYTTELLKILDLLPTKDLFGSKTVTSPIDHFSRYAVSY
jgi:hypothetical protein